MTKVRITTNRLPQPERHKGAVLHVSEEKAASLVAQGFAVIIPEAASETAAAPAAEAAAPAEAAPRRRRAGGIGA